MGDNHNYIYILVIGTLYILIGIFLFLINFTICLIHIREPLLHSNFFKVVFAQLSLEALIDLILIILNLIIIISADNKVWHIVFHTILNFCINTDIMYNIVILIYLTFQRQEKKMDDDDKEENINCRASISLAQHSFKFIHITSMVLGLVHTIIFILIADKEDSNIDSMIDWFYYFYPVKTDAWKSLIFSPFLLYLIVSIPYLCISLNRLQLTNNIHLKHYCVNCIMGAIFGLLMPFVKVCISPLNLKNAGVPLLIFSSAFFLLYLIGLCFFRYNCYYIEHILSSNGNEFFNKIIFFINIMLFRVEVPKPNFIDFNNTFIYHSLAYESDLLGSNTQEVTSSFSTQN